MDRLRSPGGCAWDAAQTHDSLVRYLIEECYELVQAIEDGPRPAIVEELGDVLLQVLFHARIAAETTHRRAASTSTTSPQGWWTNWSGGTRTSSRAVRPWLMPTNSSSAGTS